MTTKQKTLYEILGVNRTADEKDLKVAFRTLSKQYHPDINPDPEAPAMFQEIQEAYEILTDPELKKKYNEQLDRKGQDLFEYDQAFQDMLKTFFMKRRETDMPVDGKHITVRVECTAEQILRGASMTTRIRRDTTCTKCEGKGSVPSKEKCTTCKGKGGRMIKHMTPFGKFDTFTECPKCSGTGDAKKVTCATCSGKGSVVEPEDFEFSLPQDANFDSTLRFDSKGHAGLNGGKSGHLYIKLSQSPYDKVTVDFDVDLTEEKTISLKTVLSDEEYTVVFPDGDSQTVSLDILQEGPIRLAFPERGLCKANGQRGIYNLKLSLDIPNMDKAKRKKILEILGGE